MNCFKEYVEHLLPGIMEYKLSLWPWKVNSQKEILASSANSDYHKNYPKIHSKLAFPVF
jgi:hypothetical protein